MLTHELANEIVTRTMDIVPSNVNIMNAEGAVIASGEKSGFLTFIRLQSTFCEQGNRSLSTQLATAPQGQNLGSICRSVFKGNQSASSA